MMLLTLMAGEEKALNMGSKEKIFWEGNLEGQRGSGTHVGFEFILWTFSPVISFFLPPPLLLFLLLLLLLIQWLWCTLRFVPL